MPRVGAAGVAKESDHAGLILTSVAQRLCILTKLHSFHYPVSYTSDGGGKQAQPALQLRRFAPSAHSLRYINVDSRRGVLGFWRTLEHDFIAPTRIVIPVCE